MYSAQEIQQFLSEKSAQLNACRHHLHQHPEIGLQLPETSAFIEKELRSYGVDEIHKGFGSSALVAVIHGKKKSDKWIGLRADMDALPLLEQSGAEYASVNEKRAHSCGHDGHMTVALGACRFLASHRDFEGSVAVIFQPGEEGYAGARLMVENGLFEKFPIAEIYATHCEPTLDVGQIGIDPGYIMAAADIFTIDVTGRGGHGAKPQVAVDSVLVASQIVVSAQSIVSRNVNPLQGAVVSFGAILAGDENGSSVLPQTAKLIGTCRSFEPDVQDRVQQRLGEIAEGVASAYGARAQCHYTRLYPALLNHEQQALAVKEIVRNWLGEEGLRPAPQQMTAEDFAFMTQVCPGCLFRLGIRDPKHTASLHECEFDFNDKATLYGSTLMVLIALNRLKAVNA